MRVDGDATGGCDEERPASRRPIGVAGDGEVVRTGHCWKVGKAARVDRRARTVQRRRHVEGRRRVIDERDLLRSAEGDVSWGHVRVQELDADAGVPVAPGKIVSAGRPGDRLIRRNGRRLPVRQACGYGRTAQGREGQAAYVPAEIGRAEVAVLDPRDRL